MRATSLLLLAACAGPAKTDDTGDTGDIGPLTVVPVTGDITTATTWSRENLYRVDTSFTVSDDLTIEPGTIVKMGDGLAMTVDGGRVLASGTADRPCVFTSIHDDAQGGDTDESTQEPARGDWGYLLFKTSGSVLDHCLVLYGGANMPYTGAVLVQDDATFTITNSTLAYNQGGTPADTRAAALNVAAAGDGTIVTGNTFFLDDLPVLFGPYQDLDDSNVFHVDVDGVAMGSTYDGLFWGGDYEIAGDRVWSATQVPIVLPRTLSVPDGTSLTITDTVVKMGSEVAMTAIGPLLASGVTFTSLADDLVADSNGDGALSAPAPGDWGFIDIIGPSDIASSTFEYAGSAEPYTGALVVSDDAEPVIRDNILAHNLGGRLDDNRAAALSAGGAGPGVEITGNTFYDNDLPLLINGDVSLDDSNVFHHEDGTDNTLDLIAMDGTFHAVNGMTTWLETEVSVTLYGQVLSVTEAGTLTLGDDVVIKAWNSRIDVSGGLEQGDAVWFTSLADDEHGGDSTNDGTATTPEHGDWSGVNLCFDGCEWATWGNILYGEYP